MKKILIASTLLATSIASSSLLAEDTGTADTAVGKQVYAFHKVQQKQIIGSVRYADASALRVQIGENCIGLPRENFTEEGGQLKSPWAKDALQATIQGGNPADFECKAGVDQSDPAVGKQVFAMQEVQERQVVGVVKAADTGAFRVQIGDKCIGLPRQNFTEKDGQFESPWPKDALQATIDAGNPADFVCPA